MRVAALLLLACLFGSVSLHSKTIYVPDHNARIQDAIIESSHGDTIVVRPGTYHEIIDFLGKAVRLTSEAGPEATVIDGGQLGSVVTFRNREDRRSIIEGFTITNGAGHPDLCDFRHGGGIRCVKTSPTIRSNIITGNVHAWVIIEGGGIYSCDGSPEIRNNTIVENATWSAMHIGAGVCIFGPETDPVIVGNFISRNGSLEVGQGGGICCLARSALLSDNVITANISGAGAGLAMAYGRSVVRNNVIARNRSTSIGGGVHVGTSETLFENNLIVGNSCDGPGGGICCTGDDESTVANCTIVGNRAVGHECGGLCMYGPAVQRVVNSIVWGNDGIAPSTEIAGNPEVTFSNVRGGYSGAGNIDSDPLFVDPGSNDYHLTWPSPCRNSGDNAAIVAATDFEGDPRPADGTVDMGRDEFHVRLYAMGNPIPGTPIDLRIVGNPGAPVTLLLGAGVADPPHPTPHGAFCLTLPPLWRGTIGTIPSRGVLCLPVVVPAGWAPGSVHPIQSLVGSWGGPSTTFTNLWEITVH